MSYNEKALLHRLKIFGLQEGSKSFLDYEKAKKMLRQQDLAPADYEKAIKLFTNHFKCQM